MMKVIEVNKTREKALDKLDLTLLPIFIVSKAYLVSLFSNKYSYYTTIPCRSYKHVAKINKKIEKHGISVMDSGGGRLFVHWS